MYFSLHRYKRCQKHYTTVPGTTDIYTCVKYTFAVAHVPFNTAAETHTCYYVLLTLFPGISQPAYFKQLMQLV